MSVKLFFIKFAKDIKECFENICICCSTRMAEESRVVPRSVCDIENQITDDMKKLPIEPENLMEVIIEDDGTEITEEILTEEVRVEPIRSRKNITPENNSPIQNDFVVIYHQGIQPLE